MTALDLHPEELLERSASSEISAEDQARLDAHLAQCDVCRFELQARRDFQAAPSSAGAVDDLVTRALAGLPAPAAPSRRVWSVRRLRTAVAVAATLSAMVSFAAVGSGALPALKAALLALLPGGVEAPRPLRDGASPELGRGARGEQVEPSGGREVEAPRPPLDSVRGERVEPSGGREVEAPRPPPDSVRGERVEPIDPRRTSRAGGLGGAEPARPAVPARTVPAADPLRVLRRDDAPPDVVAAQAEASRTHLEAKAGPLGAPARPEPGAATSSTGLAGEALPTAASVFAAANSARSAGRHDEALRLYRALGSGFPSSAEGRLSHALVGRLLLDEGDAAAALPELELYLRTGDDALAEEALTARALALGRLGRVDDERAAWAAVVSAYPGGVHAGRARQRLAELGGR